LKRHNRQFYGTKGCMHEKVTIGSAELWCADCRDVLPELRAHACVTDPPYGVELGSTKGSGGVAVAVYCPDDNGHEIYVRERGEFEEKFEPITTGA